MSLQIAAQHLASRGRGPDTQLMHMAPGEVAGLQALAKAHGGSLTINPDTGLPEAGFLSSILPALIGGGLSIASGGTLTPLMSAMMVGGGYGLATGSLSKGLTAGLGAYGGAGLGSALAGAGAEGLAAAAIPGVDAGAAMAAGAGDATANLAANATIPTGMAGGFSNARAGLAGLTSESGRNALLSNIGGTRGLMRAGMMAAAPVIAAPVTKQPEIKTDADMGQRFKFSPGRVGPTPMPDTPGQGSAGQNFGREREYFKPVYTPIGQEEAQSMYGFAGGGTVETMSDMNTLGVNTGYPQSDIPAGAYATPYQQPTPRNIVTGVQGASVDPYTGQQRFAEGGVTGDEPMEYTFDPITQTYKLAKKAPVTAPQGGLASLGLGKKTPESSDLPQARSKQQEDYLTWETDTPEGRVARDARMQGFSGVMENILPGVAFLNAVTGRQTMPIGQAATQMFSVPQSYRDYQANFARGMDPLSGPGTLGSRDTYGSNRPAPSAVDAMIAEAVAQQAAMAEAQQAGVGLGGFQSSFGSGSVGGFPVGNDVMVGPGIGASSIQSSDLAPTGYRDPVDNRGEYYGDQTYSSDSPSSNDSGMDGAPSVEGYGGGTYARGGITALAGGGGAYNLGGYSDGGRLLRGPGDGVSDDIPALIGNKQPARLADGEFVVPARIVSELGNGSTEAGARKLYAMMDRVQKARSKSVGKNKVAANTRADKHLPA